MDLTIISQYIHSYGYIVILLVLFVGSLEFQRLKNHFNIIRHVYCQTSAELIRIISFCFLGVITGMLTAYGLGRYAGTPFLINTENT